MDHDAITVDIDLTENTTRDGQVQTETRRHVVQQRLRIGKRWYLLSQIEEELLVLRADGDFIDRASPVQLDAAQRHRSRQRQRSEARDGREHEKRGAKRRVIEPGL